MSPRSLSGERSIALVYATVPLSFAQTGSCVGRRAGGGYHRLAEQIVV